MPERTYSWEDPAVLAVASREMSGLDFLTALAEGRLPPLPALATAGITAREFSDGYALFTLEPAPYQYNSIGSIHGGILSTLADSAVGCAVQTKLPAGTGYTSLDLQIRFTRAVTIESGPLRCEGRVVSFGRRAATADARITDMTGRVMAHASSTCIILAPD
ncbi:MAG: PaaI family thioesterase [Microbacterium sp.]|nr:PaaI family thioesterase [Microbacterium sp.]